MILLPLLRKAYLQDIIVKMVVLDTTGSNINISALETMILNCKNMNTSVGMNISETAGMNKNTNIVLLNTLSVGTNFVTNVIKMIEYISGNKESKVEKDT